MAFFNITPGSDAPNDINVIIEIPAHSEPIKYEVDKASGALWVDRFVATAMHYPCDYGYINQTLSEDGDPLDVLVLSPVPLNRGCVLRCRPVAMLNMTDESGIDSKILAVPIDKLTTLYRNMHDVTDVPDMLLRQIGHFFSHYKDLEEGKWVKLNGWVNVEAAKKEIVKSIERYQQKVAEPQE
jgi:inorganic pyrophosphatase